MIPKTILGRQKYLVPPLVERHVDIQTVAKIQLIGVKQQRSINYIVTTFVIG